MEDALARYILNNIIKPACVLILVVMEDALAPMTHDIGQVNTHCLNPCCNGRCTRTQLDGETASEFLVLILVVMEDALALKM